MENWGDLYKELAEKVTNELPQIKWCDLWHNQVAFLTSELPFPTPAVFISIRALDTKDKGLLIQDCNTQIDIRLFYETFSDTYQGSYNQDSALEFLHTLTDIHKLFHGTSGVNYSEMRRLGFKDEDCDNAGNLYNQSFACNVEDASAKKVPELTTVSDIAITKEVIFRPQLNDSEPLYVLP